MGGRVNLEVEGVGSGISANALATAPEWELFQVRSDAVVEFNSLVHWGGTANDFVHGTVLTVSSGSHVLMPKLDSISNAFIEVTGATTTMDLGRVSSIDRVSIDANDGAHVAL